MGGTYGFQTGQRANLQVIKITISHPPQGRIVTQAEEMEEKEEISVKKILH